MASREKRKGGGGGKILQRKSIVPRHARKKQDMLKAEQGEEVYEKWNTCAQQKFPLVEWWSARRHEVVLLDRLSLPFFFSTGHRDGKDGRTSEEEVEEVERMVLRDSWILFREELLRSFEEEDTWFFFFSFLEGIVDRDEKEERRKGRCCEVP